MGCGSSTQTEEQQSNEHSTTSKPKETANNTPSAPKDKEKTPAANTSGGTSEFIQEAVRHHNELRAKHGVAPLTHAQDLTDYAQKWVNKIAKEDQMKHSDCKHSTGHVGENIAWCSGGGSMASAQNSVQMWYDEIKDYDFNNQGFNMSTGHFTQVVWKGSTEVGIAKAVSSNGGVYTVANYRPAGNFMGQFEQNVPPPL